MIRWPFSGHEKRDKCDKELDEEFARFKRDADEIKEMLRRMDRHRFTRLESTPKPAKAGGDAS